MSDDHVEGQSLSTTRIGCVQQCRRREAEDTFGCFEATGPTKMQTFRLGDCAGKSWVESV